MLFIKKEFITYINFEDKKPLAIIAYPVIVGRISMLEQASESCLHYDYEGDCTRNTATDAVDFD